MRRQSALQRLAAFTFATSLLLSGCAMGNTYSSSQSHDMAGGNYPPSAYAEPEIPQDMFFKDYGIRGFVNAAEDNLSTFSVDVDTGSYTVVRSYLQDGVLPPAEAVRPEEFLNYFNYDYPNPEQGETFGITIDGAPSPFTADPSHYMLRVGIQGYSIPADERPDANLTFVIDVSGSMDMENRLGLAKRALYLLVNELRPTDQVAIVVYGDTAYTVLDMTPASEKQAILSAINQLAPEGATNAEAGLQLAYRVASERFNPEAINRVVLLSDGVANVGSTGPDAILRTIKDQAAKGIALTTIGLGMGNYNDELMEQLADDGDGFYAYVDTLQEAQRVFVHQLTSTLVTIAKDAKIQVEFNADVVAEYRLVGYENRKVKDDDFRNDDVDAGEVGAGHNVTALYEVILHEEVEDSAAELATVHLRWQEPATGEVIEKAQSFAADALVSSFEEAPLNFQLANAVDEFAQVLRQTDYGDSWLNEVHSEVERIADAMAAEGADTEDVEELAQLIWLAEGLLPTHPDSLED